VRATRLNHVSIRADDLEESAAFYEGAFGLQRLATPRFCRPADLVAPRRPPGPPLPARHARSAVRAHRAFEGDDFEAVYYRTKELGAHDGTTHGYHLMALAGNGMRINAVSPSGVRTERNLRLTQQAAEARGVSFEKVEAERLQSIPMKRLVEPAEVAEVFLLLVSPRVPSMTSVEIVLDGGASPYI